MPFDGPPSAEKMNAMASQAQNIAKDALRAAGAVESPTASQKNEQAIDDNPFAFARQSLDAFLAVSHTNPGLSDDQKNLLERLRHDPRAQQLDEVVYQDPQTGQQHRFREYFSGDAASEQTLREAQVVIQRYQEAFQNANDPNRKFQQSWDGALDRAQQAERERYFGKATQAETPRAATPESPIVPMNPVVNSAWEKEMQASWTRQNKAFEEHMTRLRASLEAPLPGSLQYAALEAKHRQDRQAVREAAQNESFPGQSIVLGVSPLMGEKLPPLPNQQGYEEMMAARTPARLQETIPPNPAAVAGPNEITTMMPIVQTETKKPNMVSRALSRVASLFRR